MKKKTEHPGGARRTPFSPAALVTLLTERFGFGAGGRVVVAYSGGLDSQVLLSALAALRRQGAGFSLRAVHVDHGLQTDSGIWAERCRDACEALGVACEVLRISVARGPRESLEAVARTARYRALADNLQPDEVLLTAHHQDDQAETLLLMLLRGSGVHGLAAMPAEAPFGRGRLVRPLLEFTRAQLHAYAVEVGLAWIEDPSNRDVSLARNYLRHRVVPELDHLHAGTAAALLARSARHCADAAGILDEVAAADLAVCAYHDPAPLALPWPALSVTKLNRLSDSRLKSALRFWVGAHDLPLPGARHLAQLVAYGVRRGGGKGGAINWPGAVVRRYQDGVYLMRAEPETVAGLDLEWDWDAPLELRELGVRLVARSTPGRGLDPAACGTRVRVRGRRGGECCRRAGQPHRQKLKKLYQEHHVPTWVRARIPLLYVGDAIAAVPGLWVCAPFAVEPENDGVTVSVEFTG